MRPACSRVLPCNRARAFTLTELLVAIGLVVVLMLAVNTIFKTTADTISVGQAMSAGMRDMRSVQTIIKRDLDGAAMADGPFFMIRSSVQATFKNKKEQLADKDYNESDTAANRLTQILSADPQATGGAETAQPVTDYGNRTFRTDVLGFFSRGLFQRQTGNTGTFAASMTSNEAYVWYGHLKLPDNSGGYQTPGSSVGFQTAANNPNNFYASQWMLGRWAALLVQPDANNQIIAGGAPQWYLARSYGAPVTDPSPFAQSSRATIGGTSSNPVYTCNGEYFYGSRFDLIGTTIARHRSVLDAAILANVSGWAWWDTPYLSARYVANPFPIRPLDSASAAQTVPIFVPSCSQFIVEYSGNFTTQDPDTGHVTAGVPDGVADWQVAGFVGYWNNSTAYKVGDVVCDGAFSNIYQCIQANVNQAVTNTTYWTRVSADPTSALPHVPRVTCWYGLPRDTNGDGRVSAYADVVPLMEYVGTQATFERDRPAVCPSADYATSMTSSDKYICAWGPDTATLPRPTKLRILMKTEDPNGRADLPWQEMIFTLPQ